MDRKGHKEETVLQADDSEHLKSLVASGDQATVAEFLNEKGASVNSSLLIRGKKESFHNFSLHLAVDVIPTDYHHELVTYFISEGACLDVLNDKGYAPLHYAVEHRNIHAIQSLVDAGANINLQTDIYRIMVEHSGFYRLNFSPLYRAVEFISLNFNNDQYRINRFVCETDQEFNEVNSYFTSQELTPIHDIVKVLLSHGADCNADDHDGRAPLCHAVTSGDFNLTAILLDAGADINIRNAEKKVDPPVFSAEHQPMLKYLISRNANPELLNSDGESILHVSLYKGFVFIANYLIGEVPVSLHLEKEYGEILLIVGVSNYLYYRRKWHKQIKAYSLDFTEEFDELVIRYMEAFEKIVYLLLQSGCDPVSSVLSRFSDVLQTGPGGDVEMWKVMKEMASNPRSLQDLCIIRVRSNLQRNVTSAVGSLLLATRLKEALIITS